ncbi:MAG: hypothetical protein HC898_01105 [Phycisphaerales bacterium]|nr:hypothetical protein [Phycisphaerales bacterium]
MQGIRNGCAGLIVRWGSVKPRPCWGRCELMIGARMHACIGAVSQGVPTLTLAYSKKAAGVMGVLGNAAPVLDLRTINLTQAMDEIKQCWENRRELRAGLAAGLPAVHRQISEFFTGVLLPVLGLGKPLVDAVEEENRMRRIEES